VPSDLVVIGFSLNVQPYPEFKPAQVKAEVYTVEPSQEKVTKLTLHTCSATTVKGTVSPDIRVIFVHFS
jgi:hypothetical protein